MSKLNYLRLCLFGLLLFICAVKGSEDSKILELDDKTFDDVFLKHLMHDKNKKYMLVNFYSPNCKNSKAFEPELQKAAEILTKTTRTLTIVKVDATKNSELSERFNIENYPSIKFLGEHGEFFDYTGGRTSQEIVDWVKEKCAPASTLLNNLIEIKKFKMFNDVALIYFGDEKMESEMTELFKTYIQTARRFSMFKFGHVTDQKLIESFKIKSENVVMFKKFDDEMSVLPVDKDKFEAELSELIRYNCLPQVSSFDDTASDIIFHEHTSAIFLIRSDKDSKLDTIFKSLYPKYKGKLIFVTTDIVDELQERLADFFSLSEKDLPHVRITHTGENFVTTNYVMDKQDKLSEDNISKFIDHYFDKKLKPFYKSEEIPEKQTEPVYTVVGKNFKEVVIENPLNVMMMFYAPWCQHCEEFLPEYEKIAKQFKDDSNIIFGMMDSTANDLPDLVIPQFPTIKLYLKDKKDSPVLYEEEGREPEKIIKFIKEKLYPEDKKSEEEKCEKPIENHVIDL